MVSPIALLCDLLATDFVKAWADERYNHANGTISELRGMGGKWEAARLRCAQHLRAEDWDQG